MQVDTLASNTAMIRAASRAGFVPKGRLRRPAWVNGKFADEVILGMLVTDWVEGGKGNWTCAGSQTGEGDCSQLPALAIYAGVRSSPGSLGAHVSGPG